MDILRKDDREYFFIACESRNSFEIRFEGRPFLRNEKVIYS